MEYVQSVRTETHGQSRRIRSATDPPPPQIRLFDMRYGVAEL